ncbi:MAG TPA: HAMP domain-containing sensor histidine kinase [Luteolibacter sp.]|nr:HAMP domain-containing sensor histidine kinase [Luteolibacter sp.]
MKHPSIRLRLMTGTGLLVAITLFAANFLIYDSTRRTLLQEIDRQLLQSASLLAKSAELEATSLDYEWQEAMKSAGATEIDGVFCFWDLTTGRVTKSPELGERDLPLFHGKLNQPRLGDFVFKDGRKARIVGLLHYPFTDHESIELAATMGKTLRVEDHPQVVVCARETDSLTERLARLRELLLRSTLVTLLAIWGAIFAISTWCLRPIRELNENLLKRSESEIPSTTPIPEKLPSELLGLAGTFNTALDRVEKSRNREKEFALHAAHELRTPVAGVYATLEQAVLRPREANDLTSRIHSALGILSGMRVTLDSLMRLARLRGGLEKSIHSQFDPLECIHDSLGGSETGVKERHLNIRTDFPGQTAPLTGDPGLFRILVTNLIENAIHHAPPGSVIELSASSTENTFLFQIANPCESITREEIERWFEPFQRGSKTKTEEAGHAGLGLSLAKEAATMLGGKLRAELTGRSKIHFSIEIPR